MAIINRALSLADLPEPPEGKTGWPWTEQSHSNPELRPDDSEWPRVSIVTPSYNQGEFIEETIRSVLLQGYPNLEYIIIDGKSTDNSVKTIKKYERFLTFWISESDHGQTDAIQKGFARTTGTIWNWLNSDDILEPNAINAVAEIYQKNTSTTIFSGILTVFGMDSTFQHPLGFWTLSELICVWERWNVPQPSMFLSSHACRTVGGLDSSLKYAMDYELYLRLAQRKNFQVKAIDQPIARIRRHSTAKTVKYAIPFKEEILMVFDTFALEHPTFLPTGWEKSRTKFVYHLALDAAGNQISLSNFLRISSSFLTTIWNYRFFWATLLSYISPQSKVSDFLQLRSNHDS